MRRVLIADDETVIRMDLRESLEEAGYDVVAEACDGAEALEMARSLSPELVLMDWHLPAMNGLDTLRALRSEMPETAVVLMSMSPEPGDRDEAISLGAHAFLDKGNRFHRELLRVVAGLSPI